MKLFENFGLKSDILSAIQKLGIEQPTEIQAKSIPAILEGKDILDVQKNQDMRKNVHFLVN